MSAPEATMVAIDGTDALAFVILRPGTKPRSVVVEAAATGMSKVEAAFMLHQVANIWDAESATTEAQK